MDNYFEGLSVRKIKRQIEKIYGVNISQVAIWDWIMKYSELVDEFVDTVKVKNLCGVWHVDETVIKCKDGNKWFWEILDEDTKFVIAAHFSEARTTEDSIKLFMDAKKKSTDKPKEICVDGSYSYIKAFKKAFWSRYKEKKVQFTRRVGIRARKTNNLIERLHSTLKTRLKVTRGLGDMKTVSKLLKGWIIHYNYVRPHQSLKGKTSAEVAGINLNLKNGWADLIRLATIYKSRGVVK